MIPKDRHEIALGCNIKPIVLEMSLQHKIIQIVFPLILLYNAAATTVHSAKGKASTCIGSGDQTATINNAFNIGGANKVVQLCANAVITLTGPLQFSADGQELSTIGYPTGKSRATIILAAGTSTNALVRGYYNNLKLLNVIVDGNRAITGVNQGDASIEMGGPTTGQQIKYVASRNCRGWSCLHIAEGNINNPCSKVVVSNNDIGPCGVETAWADGISISCSNSIIANNTVLPNHCLTLDYLITDLLNTGDWIYRYQVLNSKRIHLS